MHRLNRSSSVLSPQSSVLRPRRAFTLIEVMLALFIGLILLYGMNRVFSDTANAVRAGQALGTATRNSRAVQPLLFNDFANCAADSPAFIISSCVVPQYLNATDAKAAAPLPASGCLLGDHLHRADMVMFFARGLYKRKTADGGFLTSTTTSNEAYIHIGHLRIAADGVTPIGPDDYAGAAEPYASDWVLGRNAILLADPTNVLPNDKDLGGANEDYYYPAYNKATNTTGPLPTFSNGGATATSATAVAPLGYGSPDVVGGSQIQSSRLDLAGVTMEQYRQIITTANEYGAAPFYWWAPLVYQQPFSTFSSEGPSFPPLLVVRPNAQVSEPVANGAALVTPGASNATITPYFSSTNPPYPTLPAFFRNRFQASNVLSSTPMTSGDQANLAPYMLEHASQFIVEFAGDFVTQQVTPTPTGEVTDTVPDGQIDWMYATKGDWSATTSYSIGDFVIYNGEYWQAVQKPVAGTQPAGPLWQPQGTLTIPGNVPKQIRWYGMPRDSSGSGQVYSYNHTGIMSVNELNNVVPLADVWELCTNAATRGRPLPYEVETGDSLTGTQTVGAWANIKDYASPTAGLGAGARYTAVWRNDVPTLVRILIKVDDPSNALQDGPWSEYIFKLK